MDLLQHLAVTDRMVSGEREWVDAQAARDAVVQFISGNFSEFVKGYDNSQGIIRTAYGCYRKKENYWGNLLVETKDPLGTAELKTEALKELQLKSGLPRIPSNLWGAWVALCFHFVENSIKSNLEVSIRILQSEEDESQFKFIVPRQEVTTASVRVKEFADAVDLLTGEPIESYPLPGWRSFGSSHSHNQMNAFASAVDDKYELGDPGFHVIVGGIKPKERKYEIFATITSGKQRYKIPHDALVDITPDATPFHKDVLDYISVEKFTPYVYPKAPGWSSNYNKSWQNHQGTWVQKQSDKITKTRYSPWNDKRHDMVDDYCDPFYWDANGQFAPEYMSEEDAQFDMERVKNAIDRIWDIYEAYAKMNNTEVTDYVEQHLDFLTDQIVATSPGIEDPVEDTEEVFCYQHADDEITPPPLALVTGFAEEDNDVPF